MAKNLLRGLASAWVGGRAATRTGLGSTTGSSVGSLVIGSEIRTRKPLQAAGVVVCRAHTGTFSRGRCESWGRGALSFHVRAPADVYHGVSAREERRGTLKSNRRHVSSAGGETSNSALVAKKRVRGKLVVVQEDEAESQHDGVAVSGGQFPAPFPSANRGAQSCVAYCTAENYDFDKLLKALQKERVPAVYFSEVIHISIPLTGNSHAVTNNEQQRDTSAGGRDVVDMEEGDVFFFTDGCIVFWDLPPADALAVLNWLKPYEIGPYDRRDVVEQYSEVLYFRYGKSAGLLPTGELVISVGHQNWARTQILEKIAFSYGIQRSVKVSVMESRADSLIDSLKHIPDFLTEKRALKMDQKAVMKVMGRLLSLRGLINLHLPLGETPEAYWEEPGLEDLYHKMSRELDLTARIRTLNRKLDYAHQVVEVLRNDLSEKHHTRLWRYSNDLSEKHHTRLELIIIGLIAIECVFGFLHFFI